MLTAWKYVFYDCLWEAGSFLHENQSVSYVTGLIICITLGYMLGGLKFRELRQRAQQQLGERFNLRAFHDQLMAAGAVTLPVLEEVVGEWLEQHAA